MTNYGPKLTARINRDDEKTQAIALQCFKRLENTKRDLDGLVTRLNKLAGQDLCAKDKDRVLATALHAARALHALQVLDVAPLTRGLVVSPWAEPEPEPEPEA